MILVYLNQVPEEFLGFVRGLLLAVCGSNEVYSPTPDYGKRDPTASDKLRNEAGWRGECTNQWTSIVSLSPLAAETLESPRISSRRIRIDIFEQMCNCISVGEVDSIPMGSDWSTRNNICIWQRHCLVLQHTIYIILSTCYLPS